jgi:hypothetical protein
MVSAFSFFINFEKPGVAPAAPAAPAVERAG